MHSEDPRHVLERLMQERRETYASLSRLIGRNAAYMQQFIKRGTPKRLDEQDRNTLARHFGIDEALLGGRVLHSFNLVTPRSPAIEGGASRDGIEAGDDMAQVLERDALVLVPRVDARASAGAGALEPADRMLERFAFPRPWLRQITPAAPEDLSLIRVEGDSMAPTLQHGSDIMVDRSAALRRLADGIHVLRHDDLLLVKRLAINPANGRVTVSSDNKVYPAWPECDASDIQVIGRVVWAGQRVG